jgi:thiol-disulfide isomerase/thioredoxin
MAATRRKAGTPRFRARITDTTRPRRRGRWWLAGLSAGVAVAAIAVLVIVARSGGRDEARQVTTGSDSDPVTASASAVPLSVPDIRLTAAAFGGGGTFVLSQNAHRPTIVYAMASWCLTCIPEAKALVQLEREMGDRVNIIVLDIDPGDTEQMLQQFAKAVGGAPGIWALDSGSRVTTDYKIRSLDTTIVIAGGREVARTFGPQSLDQLRNLVARAQRAGQSR